VAKNENGVKWRHRNGGGVNNVTEKYQYGVKSMEQYQQRGGMAWRNIEGMK
jgi:hypothetical protein